MDSIPRKGDHIAAHMEAIALLSLPERNDVDNEGTNERKTNDNYDSLDRNDMDLPPLLSISTTYHYHHRQCNF